MLRRAIRLSVVVLFAPAGAFAQDGVLTLDDAIAQVLARNPAVRATRAGEDEAQARIREARAGLFPRVDLIEAWDRGNQPVFVFGSLLAQRRFAAANFDLAGLNRPDPLSNHRFAAAVEQTVYDGARARTAHSAARLDADVARLESRTTALDLRLDAVKAYGDAVRSRALARSARAAADSAAEDLRRVIARRETGLETEAQVLALRVRFAETQALQIQAEGGEKVALAALNGLMGAPLDVTRPLADLPAIEPATPDVPALETFALAHHPGIAHAILRERRAAVSKTAARAGLLPHVVVYGSAESNGQSFGARATTWTAGVQVRWNVFAGGADAARLAAAAAGAARARAEHEAAERDVRLAVRSAAAGYAAAQAREAVSRQMVEQAIESRRIVRERYDAGLAPAVELLRAGELVVRAEGTRIAAVVDLHIAAATLDRAAGTTERTR
jgi:outer membrane protein TolC